MVRKGGVEPPWVAPPDPKSGASASSATFASVEMPVADHSRSSQFRFEAVPLQRHICGRAGTDHHCSLIVHSSLTVVRLCGDGALAPFPCLRFGSWLCFVRPARECALAYRHASGRLLTCLQASALKVFSNRSACDGSGQSFSFLLCYSFSLSL
jgi:hypothetical protein